MGLFSFLPTILSGAGAIFSATRKKPSSQLEDFKLPENYEDPDYRKAQDYLAKLGFDELRRMDWVPRSVHSKARRLQRVMADLEQAKGRVPTDAEMAKALKISVREYQDWLEETRPATFVCLDATYTSEFEDPVSQYESLPDHRQEDPMEGAFRHEMARLIAQRIQELPEMQRKVLGLYYFEDLRLREIAEIFGLTESRICQIHAQAILKGTTMSPGPSTFMRPF